MPSIKDLPYRLCVGIALFNREGFVFIGRRKESEDEAEGRGLWWQMPQGGLDEDEDSFKAALRELYEETSVKNVTFLKEVSGWLKYDLPLNLIPLSWGGKYRGQQQKWFAFRFDGNDEEIDVLHPGGGKFKAEFSEWRWEKLERLPDLVVPFKRQVYVDIAAALDKIQLY